MATRGQLEPDEGIIGNEDVAMPNDRNPETAQEPYQALVGNGFIGAWEDRSDIGDTLEYVQRLKDQSRERLQQYLRDLTKN